MINKKTITVKWMPAYSPDKTVYGEEITHFPPEPAFKYLLSNRDGSKYLQCPAFINHLKNTFVIKSSGNFNFEVSRNNNVKVKEYDELYFADYDAVFLHDATSPNDPLVVALPPRYIFITDSKVSVTVSSVPMILQPNKYGLIPGSFDITRWIRPVEYAVEVYDSSGPLVIKRGDPLFMVKFEAADGSTIVLEKELLSSEIIAASAQCVSVKNLLPNQNLQKLYSMSYEYIELVKAKVFKKDKSWFSKLFK